MDIEHIQLLLGGIFKFSAPVVDAFFPCKLYHFAENFSVAAVKHQHATGVVVALNHFIYGAHKRGDVKGAYIFQRLLKALKHFILYAFKQSKAIGIVGVEGRAVQLGKLANLLDGYFVYRFFFKQLKKTFLQYLLRITNACINLFHCTNFLNKTFTKIINTARTAVGYLSDSQKLTVVISLYYYYTVSVKDIQHLS